MAGKAYIPGMLTGLGENDHQNTTHVRNNTSSVVDASNGEMYLASSDTEPDKPYRRGFSFEELRKRMENTDASRVVVILDCCYSGSAKISKGNQEDAAKRGRLIIEQKSSNGYAKRIKHLKYNQCIVARST